VRRTLILVKKYTPTGRPVGRPKGSKKYPELKDSWTQGLKRNVAPEPIKKEIKNFKPKDLPSGYNTDKIISKRLNILRTETMHSLGFGKKGLSTKKSAIVRRSARSGIKQGQSKAVYTGFLMQLQKESLGALLAAGVRGTKAPTFVKNKLSQAVRSGIYEYLSNSAEPIQQDMIAYMANYSHSGRLYPRVYKKGVIYTDHRASAIGEPPAILSTELINNYRHSIQINTSGAYDLILTNPTDYADELQKDLDRDLFPVRPETSPYLQTSYIKHIVFIGIFNYLQNRYQYFTWGGR